MRPAPLAVLGLTAALAFAPLATWPGAVAAAAAPMCDGKAATIVAPAPSYPFTWVTGTPGDDVIVGTDGWDRIDGGDGNDTICGLAGADSIVGGDGDDRLFGGDDDYVADDDYWGDLVQPGAGDDYVDLGPQIGPGDMYWVDWAYADKVSYADAPGPVTVDLNALKATGHGTDTFAPTPVEKYTGIVGSPYADVLTGGPAHDQIHGGGGNDVITGGPGDDDLDADGTTDFGHNRTEVPGDDDVSGGPGDDRLTGGHGTDVLRGEAGKDYLVGQDGAVHTRLLGGPEKDRLTPAPGVLARGGGGDDSFYVVLTRPRSGDLERTIDGGPGRDKLEFNYYGGRKPGYDLLIHVPKRFIRHHGTRYATLSRTERFLLDGNHAPGRVTFRGGPGSELFRVRHASGVPVRVYGGGGRDVLVGGDRNDLLHGGPGRDRLTGGRGRDRCLAGTWLASCEVRR